MNLTREDIMSMQIRQSLELILSLKDKVFTTTLRGSVVTYIPTYVHEFSYTCMCVYTRVFLCFLGNRNSKMKLIYRRDDHINTKRF